MIDVALVYYEPIPAGQTTHVLALARGLKRQEFRVTVVLPACIESVAASFRNAGADVVVLPLRKILWHPEAVRGFVQLIRRSDFDVVHVHSQEAGLVARPLAWFAGAKRILYTPQVVDIRRVRWHWLYVFFERVLAGITDFIVSVSQADRERMLRWGISPRRVVTIPNGVDLGTFDTAQDQAQLRRELGLDETAPLVMQVGRLSAQKDPLAFVHGASLVSKACPEAQFALLGQGPLEEVLRARVQELGLDGRVHLLGWHEDGFRLMPAADVITLTSKWEGMPYTLLEAMAWSRPVVATQVNGCREVVLDGVTGLLVPPEDPAAWADRVVELLTDPAGASRMGDRGRQRVEERFSLAKVVAHIEDLYREALA